MHINLSQEEKKVLIIWTIIGILLVSLAAIVRFLKNERKDLERDTQYTLVTDYNRYYTVSNALVKFYSFINAQDRDGVMSILGEQYRKDNNITDQNITDFISFTDDVLNYRPQVMCQKKLDDTSTSYYVSGQDTKMNSGLPLETKYYEVILNSEKFIFSVIPLAEEKYLGECHAS